MAAPASPPPPLPSGEKFAAETMPFVTDRTRITWATEHAAASDHKAIALNINGFIAPVTGQPNEETASSGESRKTPRHRPIHFAPEWHHEIGDAVELLPSPLVELRRLAVAWCQRIDFLLGARET
jgi:hypothetical protein